MVFSSAIFLFAFLPIVIILHTLIRSISFRNALLICASLVFYAFGEPLYVLLLLASIAFNYIIGQILYDHKNKAVLVFTVIMNLSLLVVYKYLGLICQCINVIPFVNIPVPALTMPIGISFYTFQALSYCFDIYGDKNKEIPRSKFFDVCLYISLFPQLVAGPIVKYNSVRENIRSRKVTVSGLESGIQRFIIGLSKKMLIANYCGQAADVIFAADTLSLSMPEAVLGAFVYCLQIYFDFSGYSDMAVGMGKMFGFDFPENFDYPYVASSIRDFWKRWHISLTSWFRQYLYIPMGGNRKGKARTMFNRFFVFLCTGIWHGANFTFLLWGIYHGVLSMIETEVADKKVRKSFILSVLGHIYTIIAVMIGFVIFRADSVSQAFCFVGRMFSFGNLHSVNPHITALLSPMFIIILALGTVFSTPVLKKIPEGRIKDVAGKICSIVLYALCILEIAAGSYNPFIYFRF